jgi:hypothetical protein
MTKVPVVRVARAATHPVSSFAYAAGVVRGFAASVLRVAAGERGPLMPGDLRGPVAAPVEEDVRGRVLASYVDPEPEADRDPG